MTAAAKKILSAALKLNRGERFALAEELLGSEAESASPEEIDGAWRDELVRRADGLRKGAPKGDEWSVVQKRLRARLKTAK